MSENNAERISKSTFEWAEDLVADNQTINVSSIVPRNDKLNGEAAEVNSYLERMCSNVNMHFIDDARAINPKRHLNNNMLHLNLKRLSKIMSFIYKLNQKDVLHFISPYTKLIFS